MNNYSVVKMRKTSTSNIKTRGTKPEPVDYKNH